ncbi:MAG TPA: Maf family protein [Candidatus Methylomirabilis sp.]|nr:Maf family protein [Candidatus Methylomirabilis sp.]
MKVTEIVLASASPRRAHLLRQIGLPFSIQPSALEEDGPDVPAGEGPPEERALRLALGKAREVAPRVGRGLVVGADTMVVCEGTVLGKPRDDEEARAFLLRLAGRTHRVVTGVAVVDAETGRAEVAAQVAAVRMRPYGPAEAAAYVATGEPRDKAGAYAIQGRGALLVEAIEGDYFTVVGLPLTTLAALLGRFGLSAWDAARP